VRSGGNWDVDSGQASRVGERRGTETLKLPLFDPMGLLPVAVLSALEVPGGERLTLSTTAAAGHRAGLPGNQVVVAREHIDDVGDGNRGSPWTSARRLVYFNVSVGAVISGCVPLGLEYVASVVTRVSALRAYTMPERAWLASGPTADERGGAADAVLGVSGARAGERGPRVSGGRSARRRCG